MTLFSPGKFLRLLVLVLCVSGVSSAYALLDPATQTRKRLLENQRNIYLLLEERKEFQQELDELLAEQQDGDDSEDLQAEIDEANDNLTTADTIITNLNDTISRQQLVLQTLERATAPSTLDMAINKALNANLSELAKKLAGNEEARMELARLRSLLKQQAGLGVRHYELPVAVSYAAEQQMAEDEYLRLLEVLSSSGDDEDDTNKRKLIKITASNNEGQTSQEDFLNYVGHSQYHLETRVHSGKMTFTVDGRPWQMTVAPEEDDATYIIIYDVAKADNPRLVMFNKSLLTE